MASTLLVLCEGNPSTSGFPSQRPVMHSVDVHFLVTLDKALSYCRCFFYAMQLMWRHCDVLCHHFLWIVRLHAYYVIEWKGVRSTSLWVTVVHRGEAMYLSLIDFQWTSKKQGIFISLIIHQLFMITCISYENIFAIWEAKYINIASL